MSFLLNVLGFVVIVTGLAWLATAAGLAQAYILAGVALLACIGLYTAAASAVRKRAYVTRR